MPNMRQEKSITLWEYRRKKRRILSPVARGMIMGSLLFGWIVYCSIFPQNSELDGNNDRLTTPENKDKNAKDPMYLDNALHDPNIADVKNSEQIGEQFFKVLHRKGRSIMQAVNSGSDGPKSNQFHELAKSWNKQNSENTAQLLQEEDTNSKDNLEKKDDEILLTDTKSGHKIIPTDLPGIVPGQGPGVGFAGGMKDVNKIGKNISTENKNFKPTNCTIPAIDKFPNPIIGPKGRRYGGVLLHVLVATYMFIGLAIICDEYFVPALDRISEVLNMPPDVAGATFMAAGSSGPELATAVIGVFVAKDDIGISGVIGSAIFNITLVIAVCALAAEHDFYLSWWSVIRDCVTYLICIAVLLGTISNEIISWPEALLFLVLYVLYCVFMGFSSKIENAVGHLIPVPQSWRDVQQGGVDTDVPVDEKGATYKNVQSNIATKSGGGGLTSNGGYMETDIPLTPTGNVDMGSSMKKPNDDESLKREDPRTKPGPTAGKWETFKWAVMYPLYTLSALTIPDCRKEKWANSFVLTFMMAIFWISIYSYTMVWMITVIGSTFMIPDTVMGLTFIAAGVSVPDALAGIAVVKEGHGDMAVSNAIGSNVFDILMCLGLPWFIDTAMVNPGGVVKVRSKGLVYSTFSLFSTVVFLIAACHFNHWKLDRKFGVILLVWYFIFMSVAAMYELNVFGQYNLPVCATSYNNRFLTE